MAYPILAANSTWFTQGNTTVTRASITQINIVDSYTPTGNENASWNADVDNSGSIKCYVNGTVLTIAGNDNGKIAMNADSSFAFAAATGTDRFSNVTSIVGANLLDTSNVTAMNRMFQLASSLVSVDVSTWDTSKVTTLQGMFDRASSLTAVACENWNTSNVTNMGAVFQGAIGITSLDLSKWKTDKVTTMSSMFMSNPSLGGMALTTVGDISNWNVSNVTSMQSMFSYCTNLASLNLSNWNVSKVTSLQTMFQHCHNLILNIDNWNVSNLCTSIGAIFNNCHSITELNLSNWDVSNVTTMKMTFQSCYSLETLNLTGWNFQNVLDMTQMFYADRVLTTIICNNWNTSSCQLMLNMFRECELLNNIDLSTLDTSSCTDMTLMFYCCSSLTEINTSNWDISKVTTLEGTFASCTNLQTLDVSSWNTSSCTTFVGTFQDCEKLKTLNISNWNTSKVISMAGVFNRCSSLEELNPSNWDTSSCTDMDYIFQKCTSLTELNLSNWDTSKVTSMKSMFSQNNYGNPRSNLKIIGVENWDTSSCTNMGWMFYGCNGTGTLDFSGWDISKVTTMCHFLAHSGTVVSGYENWDTSSMINMNALFHSCLNTSYDVSKWNTSKVETFSQMFEYNAYLTEIKGLENWDTSSAKSYGEMFNTCPNLKELNLSSFNTKNVTSTWIDPDNTDAGALTDMLANLPRLEKVILGENFSFIDADGQTSCVLPTTNSDYIPEADGKWYTYDGVGYAPADVPSCVAQTYYAVNYEKDLLVKYKTMYNIAEAIRTISSSNKKYTPAGIIGGLDEVYKQGQLDLIASTEVLQGIEVEGNPIVCNNVSPVKHEVGVKLSSKNLVNILAPDYIPTLGYDVIDDNTIRVYNNRSYTIGIRYYVYAPEGTTITMSYEYELGGEATRHYNQCIIDGDSAIVEKTVTKTIPASGKIEFEFARIGGSGNDKNGWIDIKNFQVEIGDTATTYTPYTTDFTDYKVITSGKNICNLQVPYVLTGYETILLWESDIPQYIGYRFDTTVESQVNGGSAAMWRFTRADGTVFYDLSYRTFPSGKITTEKAVKAEIVNYVRMVGTIDKIQIEIGTTPTEYTEYIEPTEYTAAADGAVSGVMSICPDMTLMTEPDALINCNYYKDIDKTFAELTTAIAMSGGN